jgi:hypothetical protein
MSPRILADFTGFECLENIVDDVSRLVQDARLDEVIAEIN